MLKTLLMLALTALGIGGCLAVSPFWGVAVYYLFAVLRPQFLWAYSLPDVAWSYYVAVAAMLTTFIWRFGVVLAPQRSRGFRAPAFNVGHTAIMFFAFWVTVTYYNAISRRAAQFYYEEYMKNFIMFFVAALVVTSVRQLWILYLIITCSLCWIAYDVNDIYFFHGGYLLIYHRGYAGLDNNGAGLMLAMGAPMALFAWDGIRHWIRWAFLLCIPLIVHGVLTSYSRGAMLSLIVSIPIYFIRARHKKQLALILLGIGLLIPVLAGKEIQDRFFSIEKSEQDDSAQSRLTTWGIGWQMAQERPVFGFGIRNSNLYTRQYGADMEGRTIHSQYLQIAADSGLVGLASYSLVIVAFLICLRRVRYRMQGHRGIVQSLISFGALIFLRRWRHHENPGRSDTEIDHAYTIANGIEGAMLIFCFGSLFLSLETFELPYLFFLMAAQLWAVVKLSDSAQIEPGVLTPPPDTTCPEPTRMSA